MAQSPHKDFSMEKERVVDHNYINSIWVASLMTNDTMTKGEGALNTVGGLKLDDIVFEQALSNEATTGTNYSLQFF